MSSAFNIAWSVLKADPSQQLVQPDMIYGESPYAPSQSMDEMSFRFTPQGTMHPAITGMMERQVIQQPALGEHARTKHPNPIMGYYMGRDVPYPVERQRQGSDLQPQQIETARPTGPRLGSILSQMSDQRAAQEQRPQGSVGITPYQNVMQAM
tara:strand:+ start:73 stop:531 length:459 start_codon:yes stop_codon:yes gene_type:complete